jgi:DNA-binding response OmpR family regulator
MKPKVLIVDDEKNIGESLAAIFTSRGYESKTAVSAEQAVEIIAGWEPDLAILDVGLPKMNGIDLAIALKNGSSRICMRRRVETRLLGSACLATR